MIKNFLIAAALVIASPALVFSQDIFWSFDSESLDNDSLFELNIGDSGTAYIFADGLFGFDAIDLNFNTSTTNLLFTGGMTFNDPFNIVGGSAFNSSVVTIDAGGFSGNLFAANITQNGINPALSDLFNPHFKPGVGPNGAVLLASVDFLPVDKGGADLEFSLGTQGALQLPDIVLNPSFGSANFTCFDPDNCPEPSSAVLLVLGAAALAAQRKRA